MKKIEIDLNNPFEKTLAIVLALPARDNGSHACDETVAKALRCLYTAAHGRTIETTIGRIGIAPAVDPSLKEAPLLLSSRVELLELAERRTEFRGVPPKKGITLMVNSGALASLPIASTRRDTSRCILSTSEAGHREHNRLQEILTAE